ncbi:MAG: EAL domain-containing protein [Pseudomonadota bacterium]
MSQASFDQDTIASHVGAAHLDRISTPIWVFDIDQGRVAWANAAALEVWGASHLDELRQRDMSADMSISVAQRLRQYQEDFDRHNAEFTEQWTLYPNGVPRTISVVFRGYRLADGRMGMLCEALARSDDEPDTLRSAEALLHTSVMIALYSQDGIPLYCNPAARAGYHDAKSHLSERFVEDGDYDRLMERLRSVSGCRMTARIRTSHGIKWHEITGRECRDAVSGEIAYLFSENDISDLKETEQRVRYLADHDVLTGLPNRHFMQSNFRSLARAVPDNSDSALILLDLDRFKAVNDLLGHAAGDELLIDVATRLKTAVGDDGLLARLGGDEFLIWLPKPQSTRSPEDVADAILEELASDFVVNNHTFAISASLGISRYPTDGQSLSTLMKNADLALYDAKADGKGTHRNFTLRMLSQVEQQVQIESDLRLAIDRNELELHYQPRVDVDSGKITGAEALVRWHHPVRGMVPPSEFIPISEETGFITELGAWVVETTAAQQKRFSDEGFSDIVVSLNMSARQFHAVNFLDRMVSLSERTGCDPTRLELEITETMLMGTANDIVSKLTALREIGFGIAIDDFGTGYSNLAYIQRYPLTSLKIDRTFVSSIETHGPVTRMVMSLCQLIGVKSVAEGVETFEQLEWLREHQCDEIQGFLFSRPVPVHQFMELLRNPPALMPTQPTLAYAKA